MFPIRDHEGRVIAFGGRAMDDAPAKYLNSPESPIFSKGNVVFNFSAARQAAHDGAEAVAVEGYVDCVTIHGAGLHGAVATMGTAITEAQILKLWQLADVPVLCLDGDRAGRAAVRRVIESAFPLLTPGRSLRFAQMPDDLDPDDLVRQRGPEAIKGAVKGASGMADMFWLVMSRGRALESPEARAGLESEMVTVLRSIGDRQLREKYLADARRRISALNWQPRVTRSNGHSHHSTSPGSIHLAFGMARDPSAYPLRDAIYLAAALAAPAIAAETAEQIAGDTSLSERARNALSEILFMMAERPEIETGLLLDELRGGRLAGEIDQALAACHDAGITYLDPGAPMAEARAAKVLRGH